MSLRRTNRALLALLAGQTILSSVVAKAQNQPALRLPQFRASTVSADGDTTWFIPATIPEGARRVPVVGHLSATSTWFVRDVSWRRAEQLRKLRTRSGSMPLTPEFRLARGRRFAFLDSAGRLAGNRESAVYLSMIGAAAHVAMGLRLPDEVRRALYLEGGGRLEAGQAAPPFGTLPARWAFDGDTIAFAIPANTPPLPEASWLSMRDEETKYDPLLSGIVLFDAQRQVMEPLAHPRVIAHDWVGMEFASGSLWLVPAPVEGWDYEWTDPAAQRQPPPLARYDLTRRTWEIFDSTAIPLRAPIRAMSSDGTSLHFVSRDGIAALDTRTMRWDARFYADSAYRLDDGADTTVTLLGVTPSDGRRPVTLTTSDRILALADRFQPGANADSIDAASGGGSLYDADTFAEELQVRHHSWFVLDLLRYAPLDSLDDIVEAMIVLRGGRWDNGELFVTEYRDAISLLRRPVFRQYLTEAMWRTETQSFAFEALRDAGRDVLIDAARATLDSGSLLAATRAADSLIAWGDPTGIAWVRRQAREPAALLDAGPRAVEVAQRLVSALGRHLVTSGDSTDLVLLMDVVAAASGGDLRELARTMFWIRAAGQAGAIARAIEARALLWRPWLARLDEDSLPLLDSSVRASASRVAVSVLAMGDSLATPAYEVLFAGNLGDPSGDDIVRTMRWHRTAAVLRIADHLDARVMVPALVRSAVADTVLLYWKASVLIRLTANADAPPSPVTASDYGVVQRYWSTWWATNGSTFQPPTAAEGVDAFRRWSQRNSSIPRRPP